MRSRDGFGLRVGVLAWALGLSVAPLHAQTDKVLPLLGRCFPCHSSEEHKGGLVLETRESLIAGGDSGAAIEPGKSDESLLIEKVSGDDPAGIMPPKGKGEPLTEPEIGLLRSWIDAGAVWDSPRLTSEVAARVRSRDHWSFQKPTRSEPPHAREPSWAINPIDRFILARLEAEGIPHAPEASRETLIRRLSLDLLGLPPTPEEVEAFVSDARADAYERLVDRLLASPRYGERWARKWLDLARYADTNGYEKDRERSIWPYRDWVIAAINADMPFDQFSIEQIAGDLLPGSTEAQRIATGFHRNTMINEEGGIDVEEFRIAALVDRMATTGTTWLGLTINCAQCHTHKYDPIPQTDYYRLMAMMNNADEPEMNVLDGGVEARRAEIAARIEALEAGLADRFPLPDSEGEWLVLSPRGAVAMAGGVSLERRADGSIVASGTNPESASYSVALDGSWKGLNAIRLEALTNEALPSTGPGRTPHGNFVVTGVRVSFVPNGIGAAVSVPIASATADFTQASFDPAGVLDTDARTGWAIDDGSGHLNKDRALTLVLKQPLPDVDGTLHLLIEQEYGGTHTLGRFRISGRTPRVVPLDVASLPVEEQRRRHRTARQAEWESGMPTAPWTIVAPAQVDSRKHATMEVMEDGSVLVGGDKPNNDVYDVELPLPDGIGPITAMRLEALPHPSHPEGGPGRAPLFSVGDFILTEIEARVMARGEERVIGLRGANEDVCEKGKPARLAIDNKPDTGWSIGSSEVGRPHQAVFMYEKPLKVAPGSVLKLTIHQFGIHQMTLGRFRIAFTSDTGFVRASGVTAEVEEVLQVLPESRTAEEAYLVTRSFLTSCEELKEARAEIDALRKGMPRHPTTMVLQEREPEHWRVTRVYERGEFLKPGEAVEPGVLGALHPLEPGRGADRLGLAQWLVADENPLTARVVVNRDWHAFFGRGLVNTPEDFGTRGERPTHPELLDWLATELMEQGWSRKAVHRLIVTSATYRQDSAYRGESASLDPRNALYGRGARFRVDAEVVRDAALLAAGLMDQRIGGPSVYPPQPEGVTALAYGGPGWPTSEGADRYRRALYTFTKRTAPFAAYATFDMPTSETTCARRERSNTPLQSLTLLNDVVFLEAARGIALRVLRETPSSDFEARIDQALRLCLGQGRGSSDSTLASLRAFHDQVKERLASGSLDAKALAGESPAGIDPQDHAAWTAIARVLLNLDAMITRE